MFGATEYAPICWARFPLSFRAERGTSPLVTAKRTIEKSLVVCATQDDMRSTGGD